MRKDNTEIVVAKHSVKKRGRGGKYNFPSTVEPEDSNDVRAALSTCLKWHHVGKQRAVTDDEWDSRTDEFFDFCYDSGERPTWEKYCLAVGYSRSSVWEYLQGHKGASPRKVDIIKKAKELCAAYDAEMVTTGKMRDTPYIFRAKNYYDMKDEQEVVITPNNPLGDTEDPETIAARYAELPGE